MRLTVECKHCGSHNQFHNKSPGEGVICIECGKGFSIPYDVRPVDEGTSVSDDIFCTNCGKQNSSTTLFCICGHRLSGSKVSSSTIPRPVSRKDAETRLVNVVGLEVPFGKMVTFMVKLSFASIPAVIIVWLIVSALGAVGTAFLAGFL
jgi:hypothetical protein